MRILQLCKKFPYPAKDGETIAIYKIIKGLSYLEHDVTVLGKSSPKHPYNHQELPYEVEQLAKFDSIFVDTKVRVSAAFLNLFSNSSYNITRFYSGDYERRLRSLLRYNQYDLIQMEGLYLAQYLEVVRDCCDSPIVMRAHNVEYEIWQRLADEMSFGPKKFYFKFLAGRLKRFELKVLNEFDALVCISNKDESTFLDHGFIGPVMTLPATIEMSDYEQLNGETDFRSVFFLGGLDWIPNQEGLKWFLREVWPTISQRFPQVRFYIAGRHAPEWIKKDLPDSAEFLGEVDNAYNYMHSKGVMIVPLFSGSGMRIKIVEAMAASKAIVATSVAAEGIGYVEGRDLLIANDAEAFISKISSCLENEEYTKSLGSAAQAFAAENHDNLGQINKLVSFYEQNLFRKQPTSGSGSLV